MCKQEIPLYATQFTRSLSTEMYFDQRIEKLTSSGKHVITISDFNINLLKSETPSYSPSLQDYYLISAIDKPIPVLSFAATLMDNIFTNIPDKLAVCGNVISDISDQFSPFCVLNSSRDKIKFKNLKKETFQRMFSNDSFNNVNWNVLFANESCDASSVILFLYQI